MPGGDTWDTFLRTIIYVVVAVVLSLAIGYPVAWYAARHAGRWRGLILVLLVLPFWISYLMRMFAWTNLLADERLRDARAERALDRHAVPEARAARRQRLARRPAHRGHPRARLRLRAVPDPAALRAPWTASTSATSRPRATSAPRRPAPSGASSSRSRRRGRWPASSSSRCRCSATTTRPTSSRARPRRRSWATRSTATCRAGRTSRSGAALTILLSAFLLIFMLYYLRVVRADQRAAAGVA